MEHESSNVRIGTIYALVTYRSFLYRGTNLGDDPTISTMVETSRTRRFDEDNLSSKRMTFIVSFNSMVGIFNTRSNKSVRPVFVEVCHFLSLLSKQDCVCTLCDPFIEITVQNRII